MNILETAAPISKVRVRIFPRKPAVAKTVLLAHADVTIAGFVHVAGFSLRATPEGEMWVRFPSRKRWERCRACESRVPFDALHCPYCGATDPIESDAADLGDFVRDVFPVDAEARAAITRAVISAYLCVLTRQQVAGEVLFTSPRHRSETA